MDARKGSVVVVVGVRQSLFIRRGRDGREWEFAAMDDGGCAILCDGDVVAHGDSREETVETLLGQFLRESEHSVAGVIQSHAARADGLGPDYHAA